MSENIARFALFFPVFLFSLSFHECAHAWMANRLGDPTARLMGRMTLNPMPHIDWIGTVLFPFMMFLVPGLVLFGWAKPVPVNPFNLKRGGNIRVALAGPLSNFILVAGFAGIIHLLVRLQPSSTLQFLIQMVETGVYLNLMLAFFNLIPLPPLDGANVLEGFLPEKYLPSFYQLARYSFLILFLALYLGLFRYLAWPIFALARLILP